ncbi:MAG TPA: 23S rRNA (adenine(2503)-C(2))-methyltransferase RlmN [Candidatus Dormibacteraeota bacterium]|nr:23S rRNA (adenine(2503)-C(2))-methyltransferase RlmN [Candidatus Dormibacteraeota bacterium]
MTVEPRTLPAITERSFDELAVWFAGHGQPAYRARQLWRRMAAGAGFHDMLELPAAVRTELAASFRPSSLVELRRRDADGGLTTKRLYGLDGGHTVESVVMRYPRRATLCISSQVGCPVGCPFCATGQGPFGRNLRSHEIVDQAIDAGRELTREGRRLSHVVFMGMGEPLANYRAVLEAVRRIGDPAGLGIGPRRVTISTAGLVPRIERLWAEGLPLTLAISLHAARDELRDVLVPVNRRYPLAELVAAADRFASRTGRRVSYEWVLLAGVNDTERDARELGALLRGRLAHVNLIPFNPVDGAPYREPDRPAIRRFLAAVEAQGLNVTLRDTRGRAGDAACGQLRARTPAGAAWAGSASPVRAEAVTPDRFSAADR